MACPIQSRTEYLQNIYPVLITLLIDWQTLGSPFNDANGVIGQCMGLFMSLCTASIPHLAIIDFLYSYTAILSSGQLIWSFIICFVNQNCFSDFQSSTAVVLMNAV